jgi:hypothetical protein
VCCTAAAADTATVWPANLKKTRNNDFCTTALAWQKVGPFCSADTLNRYNSLFHVDTGSFSSVGLGMCDPTQDYAKDWLSAYFIANSIDYVAGKSWHHPVRDYLAAAQAEGNDYHDDSQHIHGEANTPNASFVEDLTEDDEITFFCPLYSTQWFGTVMYRASDFIHEAWHDVYGAHDSNDAQDEFNAHDHVLAAGDMAGDVGDDDQESVYQAQYEFLCDVDTTPAAWLPREIAWEAGVISGLMLVKYCSTYPNCTDPANQSVFQNAPPFTCDVQPPARRNPDVPEVTNGRRLRVHLEGNIHFEDCVDNDDDAVSGDFEVTLNAGMTHATWHWDSGEFGDELKGTVDLTADLIDPETIQVSLTAQQFEDGDVQATQTVGPVKLDSTNFDAPPIPINMNCCDSACGGPNDRVDLTIATHLDW